ncbi:macro domain-containing protein [Streptomyces sp. NPDC059452]|uniref:macro domain-containing protein n=1 Tax=Streptomyces sp. NPDC059452 TaxID=3346835 RepID=UPI0036ADA0D6
MSEPQIWLHSGHLLGWRGESHELPQQDVRGIRQRKHQTVPPDGGMTLREDLIMQLSRDFRNKRFWRGLSIHIFAALGIFSVALGLFDIFSPDTLGKFNLPEILAIPAIALGYALWRSWPYPVEEHYSSPDTRVRLATGDLFEQDANIVIGMSDFFDVETPQIIAENSVQGQFLSRIYRNDVSALRADVSSALAGTTPVELGVSKPGNSDRYAIGTVATIRRHRVHYFCLAYSNMDGSNNVSTSISILWESLERLWDEVRSRSNGDAIAVPIIGLGQSGMSNILPIQDAIRFLILSFIFASRRQRVCEELIIVIRPQDEKRIDMLELQEFLQSLRKS